MADSDLAEELRRERRRSEELQKQLAESEEARANLERRLALETASRQQAEQVCQEIQERLESSVQERTAELRRAIERLQQEIAARNQAEEALRQSQWLQAEAEKLAATGRMAARIAHEINNPLAGIKNSFILVKKAVPTNHPRYEFVELIEREIDRIAEIVRQMYDLHRPRQDVERETFVADTIQDVVAMLQPLCKRYQVLIGVEMSEPRLVASLPEGSLRQVLYNLLDNAIEASPCGGLVKIAVWQAENTLCVSVADQGAGIPLELRSRVFEPFFTTKDRNASSGLGLGLSICKGIVEALHGSIDFHSETGQGSTFCVKLPLHRRSSHPGRQ